jgi:hypothetical protein
MILKGYWGLLKELMTWEKLNIRRKGRLRAWK